MRHKYLKNLSKAKTASIIGIIMVLIVGFTIYKQKQVTSALPSKNNVQATVDVAKVERTDLVKRISLTGQTVPEAQVDIAAKFQGRVTAVNVKLGQEVAVGDILIMQDTGDADILVRQNQAAYRQASAEVITTKAQVNASLDKAKAGYQRALDSFERSKSLYDIGGISRDSFDASRQQLADAKAALDTLINQMNSGEAASIEASRAAAEKAAESINATQKQRSDLIIRAPRAGVIGYRQVEAGDIVPAGQKLLSIFDTSNIYVDCQVAEQDLGAFSLGMNIEVEIESLGKVLPGKVIYISPASDREALAFSLRVALNNGAGVRSGMFARSVINAVLRQNVLVVPKDAVQSKNGVSYVYAVDAGNKVIERIVQLGARGDDKVEILAGINEGEVIALTNLSRLRPGMIIVPSSADKG